MATINDIAGKTGLSVGTVSRYLNGEKLKEKNMQLIDSAIEELGYRKNALARSMRTGKSMTVAVIIPELSNMFSMRVIESIERTIGRKGYSVLIAGCEHSTKRMYEKLELMQQRMVDGFVIMPTEDCIAAQIKKITMDVPVIVIDRYLDEQIFDSVTIDNEKIVYEKIKEILAQGIRNIGFIEGPQSISTAYKRKQGYLKAMAEAMIPVEHSVSCATYSVEEGMRAMRELGRHNLEAVFASNYELTMGALLANDNPDIKIIGVDKVELASKLANVYEYVPQPIEKIGEEAAKLLIKRMEDHKGEIADCVITVSSEQTDVMKEYSVIENRREL